MCLLLVMFYGMFYLRSSIIEWDVFDACAACCLADVAIHMLRSYDTTREEAKCWDVRC